MKKIFVAFAVAVLALASCSKNNGESNDSSANGYVPTSMIVVSMELNKIVPPVKSTTNSEFNWIKGDRISVWMKDKFTTAFNNAAGVEGDQFDATRLKYQGDTDGEHVWAFDAPNNIAMARFDDTEDATAVYAVAFDGDYSHDWYKNDYNQKYGEESSGVYFLASAPITSEMGYTPGVARPYTVKFSMKDAEDWTILTPLFVMIEKGSFDSYRDLFKNVQCVDWYIFNGNDAAKTHPECYRADLPYNAFFCTYKNLPINDSEKMAVALYDYNNDGPDQYDWYHFYLPISSLESLPSQLNESRPLTVVDGTYCGRAVKYAVYWPADDVDRIIKNY